MDYIPVALRRATGQLNETRSVDLGFNALVGADRKSSFLEIPLLASSKLNFMQNFSVIA